MKFIIGLIMVLITIKGVAQVAPQAGLVNTATFTIANGGTSSAAVDLKGYTIVGFFTPAALTGTAMTFEASTSLAGTYVGVVGTGGSAVSYTVTTSKYYAVDPKDFYGIRYLKIKSGSTEGGARSIVVSLKGL